MKHLLNLGVTDPLSLGMAHPLSHRLETLTSPKAGRGVSRAVTIGILFGAATLSAPLIQADAHPEEELAGKYEAHQGKTVIKRNYNDDGIKASEHYEITVDGEDVKAYSISPSGKKTLIDIEDIEGVDSANIIQETIEGVDRSDISPKSFEGVIIADLADIKSGNKSFTFSDNGGAKFMSRDDFKTWAETEFPKWKENDFASWADGDFKAWAEKMREGNIVQRGADGTIQFEFDNMPDVPQPPIPPSFNHDDFNMKIRLQVTESKLAAARSLLEGAELDTGNSRELAKAKRELEKARKALKAAEEALKDAE
ncbi:hypothetical protein N9W89_12555 [Hellea sp.]|nr:hypothetical protein [Hellea sp.]